MVSAKFQPIDTVSLVQSTLRVSARHGLHAEVHAGREYTQIRFGDLSTSAFGGLTPQLWLKNRNDGTTACRLFAGIFRLICQNGLIIGDDVYSEKIIHIKGPKVNGFIDNFEIAADRAIESIGTVLEAAEEALGSTVTEEQAISIVGSLNVLDSTKNATLSKVLTGRVRAEDRPDTLWGLYNIVNEINRTFAPRGSQAYLQREETLFSDMQALYNFTKSEAA